MNYIDIEKSIATIKEILNCEDYVEVVFPVLTNALKTSLQALEKQIPEKPYYLNYGGCNVGNWNHGIACICDYKAPYCRYCGQKLDWEAVEDE